MCSNYRPVSAQDRLLSFFGVERPKGEVPVDMYPGNLAPFIWRRPGEFELQREAALGRFGLLPHWARDMALGRRTYNARSETAAEKPTFRDSWRRGRRCIIPAEAIYEPNWESGRAVRWRITRSDGNPMGIAGLWGWWRDPITQQEVLSFTMLTVNADRHSLMSRFHRPCEEKRMVVVLDEPQFSQWLDCPTSHMMEFMRPYPAEQLSAAPDPRDRLPDLFDDPTPES